MSSEAARHFRKTCTLLATVTAASLFAAPVAAQDDQPVTDGEASDPGVAGQTNGDVAEEAAPAPRPRRRQFDRIDLTVTVPKNESDQLLAEDCEEEADAGRIAPVDPHHMIFSIWSTTQHYADFDAQVRGILQPDGDAHFEDAWAFLDALYRRLLTPAH